MATRYFVGNGTNWSSTSSWATTSGGGSGASVPVAADDVILDGNSPGNLVIDISTCVCRSLDCTNGGTSNFTHTLSSAGGGVLTIGTSTTNGSLALTFSTTMTWSPSSPTSLALVFDSSSATQVQVTTAGRPMGTTRFGPVNGGSWLLMDTWVTPIAATSNLSLTSGTLNTNGQTLALGTFTSSGAGTRTLTLGASAITISGTGVSWNAANSSNLTLSAAASTITLTGASASFSHANTSGSSGTYGTVSITGGGSSSVNSPSGGNTFGALTVTGTSVKTDNVTFAGLTNVTGALTLTGNSITNRLQVKGFTLGTQNTLALGTTGTSSTNANVDFMDIAVTGTNNPASGTSLGDCQGNSGITFTAAVTRFAVVAGNWSSTATWSSTSGGAGGSSVPLPQDTLTLDANSAAGTYTVDMPRIGANITCTGFTQTLSVPTGSWTSFGNLTLAAGMTLTTVSGTIWVFGGRGTQTITSAGKGNSNWSIQVSAPSGTYTFQDTQSWSTINLTNGTLAGNGQAITAVAIQSTGTATRTLSMGAASTWTLTSSGTAWSTASTGLTLTISTSTVFTTNTSGTATITTGGASMPNFTVNGAGGTTTFNDAFVTNGTVTLTAGTLNTGNQTCSWNRFTSNNSTTRTLTMGSSAITLTGTPWNTGTVTNLTITANTATVTMNASTATFTSGALNYNGMSLAFTGSGVATMSSGSTFTNLTRTGTAITTDSLSFSVIASQTTTITGTLTLTGNSAVNRLLVQTATLGTQATLALGTTGTSSTSTNADFMDIAVTGTNSPLTGTSLGNALGNSGITFTASASQTWSGNTTGNWSTAANWTSRVPLPQDNVAINALTSGTVTVDMPRMGANIDLTSSSGGTLAFNVTGNSVYGNFTHNSAVTFSGNQILTLAGRSSQTLTANGGTFNQAITQNGPGGTYTVSGNTKSNAVVTITNGTISLGSGTWTITSGGWSASSAGATVVGGTSTIALTEVSSTNRQFQGGSRTYYNLAVTGGGTGTLTISGSNTFNSIGIGAPKTVTFTHGTTQTVSSFGAVGSSGNLITLNSDSAGNAWTISKASGTVSCDWLSIQDSTATGGASWFAGTNSTNVSGNTGWTFTYPTGVKTVAPAGGNWSATATWVEGAVPASTDDVLALASSGQLTIDTAASARSFDCNGYSKTLTHNAAITLSIGSTTTNGSLALRFVAGMTYTLGNVTTSAISFISTSATQVQVTSAAKTLGNVTFNGAGGSWLLADGFTNGATATVTLTTGTLNTNGQSCSWGIFSSSNSNTRTLTMGASAITITGTLANSWNTATIASMTVTSNTATISSTVNTTNSNWMAAGNLNFQGATIILNLGTNNIIGISGGFTVAALQVIGGAGKTPNCVFWGNFTVTGTFTVTGNSAINRVLVQSTTLGTAISISAATVSLTNADFMDITGAGAASPFSGTSLGDCQGNSNITFTAAVTRYAVAFGNWSSTSTWSGTTGGGAGSSVPLPQDTVVLDGNTAGSITADMPRLGKNVATIGATGFLHTLTVSTAAKIFGNLTLYGATTFTQNQPLTLAGRGTQTLTSAGNSFINSITISAPGGTYTLQDTLTISTNGIFLIAGTLTATSNVSATQFTFAAGSTLNMGSGTWTASGTATVWNMSGTCAVNAGTSTVVLSNTTSTASNFVGQSKSYNNLKITGGGTGAVTISGSNTFNQLSIGAPKTVTFTHGTTQTTTRFSAVGSSGNVITMNSDSSGNAWTLSQASGTVSSDYLSLQDSTATGGASWYAGSNTTNVSNNTGWNFSYAPNVKTIAPGGGNWSSSTTWVEGAVPASTDDVIAILSGSSGQLTIDAAAAARSADFTGYTNTLTQATNITLSLGSSTSNGNLSLKFNSTMTYIWGGNSMVQWVSTSGVQEQITTAGQTYAGSAFPYANFNGSGGSWIFVDAFSAYGIFHQAGTLNTNSVTVGCNFYYAFYAGTRTLTLGASTINVNINTAVANPWQVYAPGFTLNAGTSTINILSSTLAVTFAGGGLSYNNVTFVEGSGASIILTGANTFAALSFTGTTIKDGSITFPSASTTTVTGTLTIAANSVTNRLLAQSDTVGIAGTVSAGSVALTNVDFMDITAAGAAIPWTGTSLGDCLGNSNITFTTAITQTWNGNSTGNWSTAANWTSRVPLPQDNVAINALTSGTITFDMPRLGTNVDFTASSGGVLGLSSTNLILFGNLKLAAALTSIGTQPITFGGRGSQTITSAGFSFPGSVYVAAPGGTYQLQDNFVATSTSTLTLNNGTFDANVYNVTVGIVSSSPAGNSTRAILMGSGTWTVQGVASVWNVTTSGLTLTPGASTIVISDTSSSAKTFAGGSATYSNLSITGGGTGAVTISGGNTFNTLSIGAPKTVTFTHGTTQTVSNFGGVGTSGNVITLNSDSSGNAWAISKSSGTVSCDWLSLQDSTATGGAGWYAGSNSTNVSNNTGWNFSYPANVKTISAAGGNYSATTAWVEGAVPTATDAVGAIPGGSSGALTINTNSSCLTFDMTNYTNTLTHTAAVTFTIAGNKFLLVSGMSYALGNVATSALAFTQSTSGTVAIATGGKTLGNVTTASGLNSSSATYQLQDTNTIGATATWTHTAGTLNTNNQTVSWGLFNSSNGHIRTLTFGSSSLSITGTGTSWNVATTTGLTLTAGTSTITLTGISAIFAGGAKTYNNVVLSGSGAPQISGSNIYANLTRTGTAVKTDALTIVASNPQTVTGTLTLTGNSMTNRLEVLCATPGTPISVTAAAVSLTNVDFSDIVAGGAAIPWTGTSLGDCQGNSNITFTTAVTRYAVSAGNWSSTATWASTSGGTGGQTVPLPQDTVYFDGNSGSGSYAADMPRMGANLTFTGFAGTLATGSGVFGIGVFGNLTLASGMTITVTSPFSLSGRGAQMITSATNTFPMSFNLSAVSGSYTLQDDATITSSLQLNSGTLNANGHNVTAKTYSFGGLLTPTINMGSGTWTATGTGGLWTYFGGTINPGTSTIDISDTSSTSKTFAGAGLTYNNFSITGGGTGAVIIQSSNTFNQFSIGAPKTVTFSHSNTQTVSRFSAVGSSGNVITINSDSAGNAATLSQASGTVSGDYLSLKDSTATGGASWYAGTHSTNVSNNTGWTFSAATGVKTIAPGGGNWSSTTTWVEGAVPASTDDVIAILSGSSGQLTIDTAASARSMDFTGYTNTLTHNANITLSIGSSTANGSLALTFVSGMVYTLGDVGLITPSIIAFVSTSATQLGITTAGKVMPKTNFSGAGGSWVFMDAFAMTTLGQLSHTAGSLSTGSQTCSWGYYTNSSVTTHSLTLGSSQITITYNGPGGVPWSINALSYSLSAGTSTITFLSPTMTFIGGGLTYNNIVFNGSGFVTLADANTYANLTRTGTAVKTDSISTSATQTITGTLTLTGNSLTNRLLVQTDTIGTARSLSAASVSITNVDFMDITGAGAAVPFTGTSLGDCQGNSNITFTTAVTRYAVASGNWSSTAMWSTSSGGTSGASVPLPQDTVNLDANSSAGTYTVDMPRMGASLTLTGFMRTLTLATGVTSFGNITMASGMTFTGVWSWVAGGRGSQTLTCAGKTFLGGIRITAPGGSYTLQDAFSCSILTSVCGTFNDNGQSVTLTSEFVSSGTITRAVTASGNWNLSGPGILWSISGSGTTFTPTGMTITISDTSSSAKTFAGGGVTYNNLQITGGGTGPVTISGSNTFNTLSIGAPKTVTFTAGTTNTVSSFVAMGSAGNIITLNSSAPGTQATLSSASGPISCDYLAIQDSNATGGARWNAGNNSIDNGDNTGWIFGGTVSWTGWGTPL